MANLIVVFTDTDRRFNEAPPVSIGEKARTEQIVIGVASAPGTLVAVDGETIVELYAQADCWYAIGANPTAVAGSGRFIKLGERREHSVNIGSKVAAITV